MAGNFLHTVSRLDSLPLELAIQIHFVYSPRVEK